MEVTHNQIKEKIMASTFLKKNFPSMRGAISEKEEELLKKTLPSNDAKSITQDIKGSISDKEFSIFKKLLEEEQEFQ